MTTLLDDIVPLFDITWLAERLQRLAFAALTCRRSAAGEPGRPDVVSR